MSKKILSVILVIMMCISIFPIGALATEGSSDQLLNAQAPVPYLTYDAKTGKIVEKTTQVVGVFSATTGLDDGWYFVDHSLELNGLEVRGNANLILKNGCTLTVNGGIDIPETYSLTIYAQSSNVSEMGTLKAFGSSHAGLGTGDYTNAGTITINGGIIVATGGFLSAGIGGGYYGNGANVKIGGNCSVYASAASGPAIGRGDWGSSDGTFTIANGFKVTNNYTGKIAVKSDFILDKEVSITAEFVPVPYLEPGITNTKSCTDYQLLDPYGDSNLTDGWYVVEGEKSIYKDILGQIGSLVIKGNVKLILENGCKLNVNGIYVTKYGSLTIYAQSAAESEMGHLISNGEENCAGIGGIATSYNTDGHGELIINGGFIEATGGDNAAGIGGGSSNRSSQITINGGKVIATGGKQAAGIGGGNEGKCGFITINGGYIEANGDAKAAGIGGGYAGAGGTITINGGEIKATGGKQVAGIGSGLYGEGGNITLSGGIVHALGGDGGAGIGGGDKYKSVSITITGYCTVDAKAGTGAPNAIGKGLYDMDLANPGTIQINAGIIPVDKNGNQIKRKFDNPTWISVLSDESVYFETVPDPEYPVSYLACNYDKETNTNIFKETQLKTSDILFKENTTLKNGGWYVLKYNGEFDQPLVVNGNVNLILMDGRTLKANKGIRIPSGSSLTIYGQSTDESKMGRLIATGDENYAGIGGGSNESHGTIIINGGYIEAQGGYNASGIGGGKSGKGGIVTVNGGIVKATGGYNGAGIGGGNEGAGGTLTVNGGVIIGTDGETKSYSGHVETKGGYNGAGIGGGSKGAGGKLTVNDGYVEGNGNNYGAGIGGGEDADGGTVTVNGGYVEGNGDICGAGIGGGDEGSGGIFTINGGEVKATGGLYGAGIGGGYSGPGGKVTLAGGKVEANGGGHAAGIGGGYEDIGAAVKIIGNCTVKAEAGSNAPRAIGHGEKNGDPSTIEVANGITVLDNKTGEIKTSNTLYPTTNWLNFLSAQSIDFTAMKGKTSYYVKNGTRSDDLQCTIMTNEATVWSDSWYVVSGECTIPSARIEGKVNLILENGCNLTVGGIHVPSTGSLTIYAQSSEKSEMGHLLSTGATYCAGIGGIDTNTPGEITINGGYIEATGGIHGAGIGGGNGGKGGTVTVNEGIVVAKGRDWGAGIGGGDECSGGTFTINDGEVYATGGMYAAGIGGGFKGAGGNITINGGYVDAKGSYDAAGIGGGEKGAGGNITFAGGNIKVLGGYSAPAIGGGNGNKNSGAIIKITGSCTVKAEAGNYAPRAIGNGKSDTNLGGITVEGGITMINNKTGTIKTSSGGSYSSNWLDFLSGTSVDFTAMKEDIASNAKTDSDTPPTGDSRNMTLLAVLVIASFMGLFTCIILGKKRRSTR